MATEFADWLAICETKARYCRLMDTKDWAGWADCFTEDLVLDSLPAGGYRVEGRGEAIRAVRSSINEAKTAHQVHNPEMIFDADGNGANVIWALNDRVEMAPDRQSPSYTGHNGFGNYHERYVRCADGRWRIAKSQLSYFHMDMHVWPT